MSLISEILKNYNLEAPERELSKEEKEIKKALPHLDEIDRISVTTDYTLWKGSLLNSENVTFDDFKKSINSEKQYPRRKIFNELKKKALKSLNHKSKPPQKRGSGQ